MRNRDTHEPQGIARVGEEGGVGEREGGGGGKGFMVHRSGSCVFVYVSVCMCVYVCT